MAVSPDNEKPEFGARVPRVLFDEFKEYYPGYGAVTWFVNTALETFLVSVRNDPEARKRVQLAIDKMVTDNRNGEKQEA